MEIKKCFIVIIIEVIHNLDMYMKVEIIMKLHNKSKMKYIEHKNKQKVDHVIHLIFKEFMIQLKKIFSEMNFKLFQEF